MAKRLAADRKALIAGGQWPDAAELTGVQFGQGDVHCGGRTVSVLTFADSGRIVRLTRVVATASPMSVMEAVPI